jgi:hypothetical protein
MPLVVDLSLPDVVENLLIDGLEEERSTVEEHDFKEKITSNLRHRFSCISYRVYIAARVFHVLNRLLFEVQADDPAEGRRR